MPAVFGRGFCQVVGLSSGAEWVCRSQSRATLISSVSLISDWLRDKLFPCPQLPMNWESVHEWIRVGSRY
jgi:hypothetical protein